MPVSGTNPTGSSRDALPRGDGGGDGRLKTTGVGGTAQGNHDVGSRDVAFGSSIRHTGSDDVSIGGPVALNGDGCVSGRMGDPLPTAIGVRASGPTPGADHSGALPACWTRDERDNRFAAGVDRSTNVVHGPGNTVRSDHNVVDGDGNDSGPLP